MGSSGVVSSDLGERAAALPAPADGEPEPDRETKAPTHLIEASNESIRDSLTRFNRRSKRSSKTPQMLQITLAPSFFLNKQTPE